MGDYSIYYITRGPIRGACEHRHRTIGYAYHCLRHDIKSAENEGTFSDRRIYAVDNGLERELLEHEILELDSARRDSLNRERLKQERRRLSSDDKR